MRGFRRLLAVLLAAVPVLLAPAFARAATAASPEAEQHAFQAYFHQQFPKLPVAEFANGPYPFDAGMRKQWEDIMQFPPYDFALDAGKQAFGQKFPDGKSYADCFAQGGIGIRQTYPYFDTKTGEVVTLDLAINRCRTAHGLKPLKYGTGEMAAIDAYMSSTSRGKPFAIVIPKDPRAVAAYEDGKRFFYTRRGQLNFACSSCHVQAAGKRLRGDVLAPAFGILAAFPIYRSKWGSLGTVDRRFTSCMKQVRAVPLKPESKPFRDLEYFLSYMSNGVPISGPGARP